MPVSSFSKVPGENLAEVIIDNYFERLEIDCEGDAIAVLEFIIQVNDSSPISLSKLDIIIPNIVTQAEDVTKTFFDLTLHDNQVYTQGFECINEQEKIYNIDGIEAIISPLIIKPEVELKEEYSRIRIRLNKIDPGISRAFRIKINISNFAKIYPSLGVFEIPMYYAWALSSSIEDIKEWNVNGIEINRKYCEIWVTLPREYLFRMAIPQPQQIKVDHEYKILSHDKYNIPRSAVYWDLEDNVFELPGRNMDDKIKAGKGVRIYCEITKPHVTPDSFERKMSIAIDKMEHLAEKAIKTEKSLNFIERYGKKSFIITFLISITALIVALLK